MAEGAVRKSGRARVLNKKYAQDKLEFTPEPEAGSPSQSTGKTDNRDVEYDITAAQEVENDLALDEDSDSSVHTPEDDNDEPDDLEESEDNGRRPKISRSGKAKDLQISERFATDPSLGRASHPQPKQGEEYHTRGQLFSEKFKSAKQQITQLAGSDEEDRAPLRASILKWASNVSLPSKRVDGSGAGGMDHHPLYTKAKRDVEGHEFFVWYHEKGGQTIFRQHQNCQFVNQADSAYYYPKCHSHHSFLHGPYSKQNVYDLEPMKPVSLDYTWKAEPYFSDEVDAAERSNILRYGWLLNVGARPRCLAWAPHHSGSQQYLAISTFKGPRLDEEDRSAFTPQDDYPACVQIWAFAAAEPDDGYQTMRMDRRPILVHAICSSWGSAKQLQWNQADPGEQPEREGEIWLGMLGGVWSDGFVRVLDVWVLERPNPDQFHVEYRGAAFEARPASTICTGLTWVSATKIAAGCANAHVAIWNVAKSITSQARELHRPASPKANSESSKARNVAHGPKPFFYQLLHQSFILSIVSTYPQHPYFIATTSIDGHTRLTDLRHPHTDTAVPQRMRLATPPIAYSAHAQSVLTPEDGSGVRALPLRRFVAATVVGRVEGQVMAIASSPVHSSVLVGSTEGGVIVTNPLRRLVNVRGAAFLQQIFFKHEFVPLERLGLPAPAGTSTRAANVASQHGTATKRGATDSGSRFDLRAGVSRITEGYRMQNLSAALRAMFLGPVAAATTRNAKPKGKGKRTKKDNSGEVARIMTSQPRKKPRKQPRNAPSNTWGGDLEDGVEVGDGGMATGAHGAPVAPKGADRDVTAEDAHNNMAPANEPAVDTPMIDPLLQDVEMMINGSQPAIPGQPSRTSVPHASSLQQDVDMDEPGTEQRDRSEEPMGVEGGPSDRGQAADDPGLTIYEEETAVTCLAWCPAPACGGWAAAGMGSGMVRIEDIAIE